LQQKLHPSNRVRCGGLLDLKTVSCLTKTGTTEEKRRHSLLDTHPEGSSFENAFFSCHCATCFFNQVHQLNAWLNKMEMDEDNVVSPGSVVMWTMQSFEGS
jgi:hypothetical protein